MALIVFFLGQLALAVNLSIRRKRVSNYFRLLGTCLALSLLAFAGISQSSNEIGMYIVVPYAALVILGLVGTVVIIVEHLTSRG